MHKSILTLLVAGLATGSASVLAQAQPQSRQPQAQAQAPQAQSERPAGQAAAARGGGGQAMTVAELDDVEELQDNIQAFIGQRVRVPGEVEDVLGPRSFVLESGGIFDDEIVVVIPARAQGMDPALMRQDTQVTVTGTVRSSPIIDIERETGWDFDPELEIELEGTRIFLVADSVQGPQA